MILKYKTNREVPETETESAYKEDVWNFVDGIIGASIYFDKGARAVVADLEFDNKPHIAIALYNEAYLLNENGTTIEKIRI